MILADTSAWVEYDLATGSAVHKRMVQLIAEEGPCPSRNRWSWKCWLARSDPRALELRRLLLRFRLLRFETVQDVDLVCRCQIVGITLDQVSAQT